MIVVVDDEPLIRALVADALDDLGYDAVEAGDAHQGLEALDSLDEVALLITDVGLPKGMNGRQLADAARVKRPTLKVLFITGHTDTDAIGGKELEHDMHVLHKPFDLGALAAKVRELIEA